MFSTKTHTHFTARTQTHTKRERERHHKHLSWHFALAFCELMLRLGLAGTLKDTTSLAPNWVQLFAAKWERQTATSTMAGCNSNNIVVAMPIASQQLWQRQSEGTTIHETTLLHRWCTCFKAYFMLQFALRPSNTSNIIATATTTTHNELLHNCVASERASAQFPKIS